MKHTIAALLGSLALIAGAWAQDAEAPDIRAKIQAAMAGEHRSEENKARDQYRHPLETLEFFGLRDDMTVMEIWPGAGWYTEILGPVLKDNGQLIAVAFQPDLEYPPEEPTYRFRLDQALMTKLFGYGEVLGPVRIAGYIDPDEQQLGKNRTVDMVLTFRNAHGWIEDGVAQEVFVDFYDVLKRGGLLGVVQHRAAEGTDPKETAPNGYVSEAAIIALAEEAGFELVKKSEINANPKDTRDHPEGVWTLPPSLRLGDEDREKYEAIGESDRMTLLFRKN